MGQTSCSEMLVSDQKMMPGKNPKTFVQRVNTMHANALANAFVGIVLITV
jgi:hypothetical protein